MVIWWSDFGTFGPTVIWRGKFSLRSQMSFLTVATFTCFSSSPSRPWILVRSRRSILKLILVLSYFLIWILSTSMSHDYYSLLIQLLQRSSQLHTFPVGHFEQTQELWKWKTCLQDQEVPCTASFHTEVRISQSLDQKCEIEWLYYYNHLARMWPTTSSIASSSIGGLCMWIPNAGLQVNNLMRLKEDKLTKEKLAVFLKLKVHLIPKILLTVA